jgi:hypothetical protein
MKRQLRKLSLNRETLRNLEDDHVKGIAGGATAFIQCVSGAPTCSVGTVCSNCCTTRCFTDMVTCIASVNYC